MGFMLVQLAVAAGLLVLSHSIEGEIASVLLIFPAIAARGLAFLLRPRDRVRPAEPLIPAATDSGSAPPAR